MNCTESAMSVAGNPRVGARRHVGGGESMSQAMESMWEMELGLMPFVLELFSAAIAYVYLLRRKGRFLSRAFVARIVFRGSVWRAHFRNLVLLRGAFTGGLVLRDLCVYHGACRILPAHFAGRADEDGCLGWRERLVLPFARGGIFAGISRGGQEDGAKSPL